MSMEKGGRKQNAVFHTPEYGTLGFPEYFRGKMILGSHSGKYRSRLSISKYMGSQAARKTLYPDLHKCKVSYQAPKRSNLVLKNGLKISICTGFKTQNLSQFPTAP